MHRFTKSTDEEILQSPITLHNIQFSLAIFYDFKDWKELKAHVESKQSKSGASEKESDMDDLTKPSMNGKILIVDDDQYLCESLTWLIKRHFPMLSKFSVVIAGDGEPTLKHINRHTPLFLILNMNMPRIVGAEVLQELSDRDERFPILVISGYVKSKEHVSELGKISKDRFEFLNKPFKVKDFLETVEKMTSLEMVGDSDLPALSDVQRIEKAILFFRARTGREPNLDEIANEIGIDIENLSGILRKAQG